MVFELSLPSKRAETPSTPLFQIEIQTFPLQPSRGAAALNNTDHYGKACSKARR